MFLQNETATRVHSDVPPERKTGTRAHSPKPPFYETALLSPSDKGPGDTLWDTSSDTAVCEDSLGDFPRDTRARETPVAGRRDRNSYFILLLL